MEVVLLEATLNIANLVIATFTLVYGFIFLIETVKHEHRKIWNFLLLAIVFMIGFQTLKLFRAFGVFSWESGILTFELGFNCVLLYVFIFQRDILLKYAYIKIERIKKPKRKLP